MVDVLVPTFADSRASATSRATQPPMTTNTMLKHHLADALA